MSLTRTSGRSRSNASSASSAEAAVLTWAPASCRTMLKSSRASASSSTTSSRTPRRGTSRVRADPSPGCGAAAVRRAELDRIREQVPDDLLQPIGIGEERTCVRIEKGVQLNLLRIRHALDGLDGGLDDGDRVDLPAIDPKLARDDAGDVEE